MLIFWILIFLTAIIACAVIALPVLRPQHFTQGSEGKHVARSDFATDLDYGFVTEAGGDDAVDVVTEPDASIATTDKPFRAGRLFALALIGIAPLAAIAIYLNIGSPDYLQRSASSAAKAAVLPTEARSALAELADRAKKNPNDPQAWMALGNMQVASGLPSEAIASFQAAVDLRDDDSEGFAALGEAISMAANGAVTAPARAAFERAVALDKNNPRARYYLAEARFQAGSPNDALAAWAAIRGCDPDRAFCLYPARRELKGHS